MMSCFDVGGREMNGCQLSRVDVLSRCRNLSLGCRGREVSGGSQSEQ